MEASKEEITMVLQRMQGKLIPVSFVGEKAQPKNWNVRTELKSKNAERWEFLTVLPSSCCIMKLKPI